MQAHDLGRTREVVSPYALPGEFGALSLREKLLPGRRVQAVGADYDVVAPSDAVRERDLDLVAEIVDRACRHAKPDAGARRSRAATQHLVQRAAPDADIRRIRVYELRRGNLCEVDALGREHVHVIEAEPCIKILSDDTEVGHRS